MRHKCRAIIAAVVALSCLGISVASAACIPINSESSLKAISNNMAGNYCLTVDITLTEPFEPNLNPFKGNFEGNGHTIRGLTINAQHQIAGLFSWIEGGRVSNLTLAAVSVRVHSPQVGAVAGLLSGGGTIDNVHVSGFVKCYAGCTVGGIAGRIRNGTLQNSSSTAQVMGGGGSTGGAVGENNGTILRSYATGFVSGVPSWKGGVGGLVGYHASGVIKQSFAAGRVLMASGFAGGLTGYNSERGAKIVQSYSLGSVHVLWCNGCAAGSFSAATAYLSEVFAVGPTTAIHSATSTCALFCRWGSVFGPVHGATWDLDTTGKPFSRHGVPRTTRQLQAKLPPIFGTQWGITKSYSYPYLNVPGLGFSATLATLVKEKQVYTFLPIGQREPMEYGGNPVNADAASLATVYTMMARAIGRTRGDPELEATLINDDFWDDVAKTATWQGPVTSHATLLAPVTLTGPVTINDSNILGALKNRDLVILQGSLPTGEKHWMLATLFRTDTADVATYVIANDPWTGKQVRINVKSRRVMARDFPLDFKVDAYQVVQLN
jgi:hypothetical protein